jgi:glucokinase-like ROK family protein
VVDWRIYGADYAKVVDIRDLETRGAYRERGLLTSSADEQRSPNIPSRQFAALVAVLDEVRRGRAHTRSKLTARTGLSRAVVAQRVAELVERGLLEDAELGTSTGGRRPRSLRFRSEAGYVLAAELGATSISVALSTLSAELIEHQEEPADIAAGPDVILGRVQQLFDEIGNRNAQVFDRLWGIGIGVPGPVEFSSGRPIAPPIMPGWDRFPVRDRLTQAYNVPVWVDNDVNVLALGEVRAGVARDQDLVVFVKIGTGIGVGIVINGSVLRGAQGCAGDAGHIQITEDPSVVCRCGNIGCLEALAGGAAIGWRAEAMAREGRSRFLAELLETEGRISAADVARAAAHGDRVAVDLITDAGRLVGRMLASLVNFLNPSLIVIGGGVARSGETFLAAIRHTMYRRSLPLATRDLATQRTILDGTGGLIGAASMVLDELFAPPVLVRWIDASRPTLARSVPTSGQQ